jgi:hypothetical protein
VKTSPTPVLCSGSLDEKGGHADERSEAVDRGATLGAMALTGGTAAASDYPPGDESVTTVPQGGETTPSRPGGSLPATGPDSGATLKIAGGAGRRRRRPPRCGARAAAPEGRLTRVPG